jgi:hypothetical protein
MQLSIPLDKKSLVFARFFFNHHLYGSQDALRDGKYDLFHPLVCSLLCTHDSFQYLY